MTALLGAPPAVPLAVLISPGCTAALPTSPQDELPQGRQGHSVKSVSRRKEASVSVLQKIINNIEMVS